MPVGRQGLRLIRRNRRGCKLVLVDNDVSRDVKAGRKLKALVAVQGRRVMTEFEAKLERFESLAAECDVISRQAADRTKRDMYLRLGQRYRELAGDMRTVIATSIPAGVTGRDSSASGVQSTH